MCTGYHREVLTETELELETVQMADKEQHSAVLRELCAINGVSYDHLERGSGHKVTKLESFFFGTPCIPHGLVYFPALTELRIVNQKFTHISGLDSCVGLTQLWICEGQLECIEGLSACTNLTSLYLYTNRITKIGGLDTLTKLHTLWLNGNLISTIQGLDNQGGLQELNLAHNNISLIETSLDHLTDLVELNLSGNHLWCLCDLVHLSCLPRLTTLSLCDPLYTPNPVATLCNYSTHILYHLPALHWLDGVSVASEDLHSLVEGVVHRKKRFYRMKTHHIQMEAWEKERRIRACTEAANNDTYSNIREVQRQLKSVSVDPDHHSSLTTTMEALDTHLTRLERECCVECERVWGRSRELCQRWSTELESGGNVRFLTGGPNEPWVSSCEEIVQSRLTVTQGVSGVEVTGIVKVENRLQYTRFNDKMKVELKREVFSSLSSWKSLLDYLFIVWQPGMTCLDLCRDKSSSAHVTNSVNLADALRIADMAKGQGSPDGELLLCKVFVGLSSQVKTNKVPCVGGDGINTVCRLGEGGQKEWFLADSDLLLPEYILSVRYSTPAVVAERPPVVVTGGPVIALERPPVVVSSERPPVVVPGHPRLAMLDESTLLARAGTDTLISVKELCFHDNHLTRFRLASSLPCLVKLILSCNEMGTVEDLRNMPSLEELDISFNRLFSLDGLKGVPKLKMLDVRGNLLASGHQVMSVLRKHTPSLQCLDLRYNPWDKVPCESGQFLGYLKTLRVFNGAPVSEEETRGALRQVVNSHLSLSTLISHAHTHTHTPHTLTLRPLSQILHTDTQHRASQVDNWTHTVTSVCLDGLGLQRLTTLEEVPNLRWCSLANNDLTSIEVVMKCSRLEELVLDGNHLQDLPSLHTLTHLTHLSLAHNLLSSLPPLLPQLAYLNVSYNKLSSLGPLKYCVSLVELYASGNTMATTRQLFPLKALTSLAVCDLSANPVTQRSEYRHFVIYHCSSLKALDGTAVEGSEVVGARERMGGRLCQDLVFERHHDTELSALRQLDVTHAGIKIVDLSPVSVFNNLASLNLEHNSLTSFSGLLHLNCLKVLCLNHNRVEALVSPRDPPLVNETVLTSLQVLHLAYNGIRSLSALQLGRIPSLRALFLQGNELSTVDGLDGLHRLTELVLDRNKVKALHTGSFVSLSALRELHIEENRLKDLSHLTPLVNLQRLYLGMNKIQDFNQLEVLSPLHHLVELSLVSNPISRRLQHRGLLVYLLPSLVSLDGLQVSGEERAAAHNTFTHSQQEIEAATVDSGMNHGTLLKVMNVPFGHQMNKQSAPAFTGRRK